MSLPPNKHRVCLSLDADTIEAIDFLKNEFKLSTRSDLVAAVFSIITKNECKIKLRKIYLSAK